MVAEISSWQEEGAKRSATGQRSKALEARQIAESLASPEAREHMIAAASAYERLDALLEKKPLGEKPEHSIVGAP